MSALRTLEDGEVARVLTAYKRSLPLGLVYEEPNKPLMALTFDGCEFVSLANVHGTFAVYKIVRKAGGRYSVTRLEEPMDWPPAFDHDGRKPETVEEFSRQAMLRANINEQEFNGWCQAIVDTQKAKAEAAAK